MIVDGHVHTPFCPHGTRDTLKHYIENAISKTYSSISFTEHAPLPPSFKDPVPTKDSGMDIKRIDDYITTLGDLKRTYEKDITIHIGLEVDYIEGYQKEITNFLNQYGPYLTDSILSVHFLLSGNEYVCLDYNPASFQTLVNETGGVDEVHRLYYKTLLRSIEADLGPYKPTRIGHMTLSNKFQSLFPTSTSFAQETDAVLEKVKEKEYSLDVNTAGLRKPYCQTTYPPLPIVKKASQKGIKLIYGSDAHKAEDLGAGYDQVNLHLQD
ncbi:MULTISPECIES: histidinol-phosphatase HisJ [Pontibacillus]|uniref:Histidinol-phosphatase n=1 Tax=Pontibacillus chungwhensis TaxID=265426 RepID=A0ABY8UUT7_9BACI|nr:MULTISPECIES: histidinol-phosphatase HisJ [Pontibacillus]MCD5323875.1 histidinol-phosphatase HisJ [Pontibacillus sp. HN14]WIF97234.1 histidinol-phosphatase HisJ [Pontibacillus chungwhensis]